MRRAAVTGRAAGDYAQDVAAQLGLWATNAHCASITLAGTPPPTSDQPPLRVTVCMPARNGCGPVTLYQIHVQQLHTPLAVAVQAVYSCLEDAANDAVAAVQLLAVAARLRRQQEGRSDAAVLRGLASVCSCTLTRMWVANRTSG